MKKIRIVSPLQFTFYILFFTTTLFAQFPQQSGGNGRGFPTSTINSGIESDTLPQGDIEIDTAVINYFYADNIGRLAPEKDSLLDNNFHQYDPARQRSLDYFNLGYATAAAYPSVYQPFLRRGLDIGLHAFDIHQIKNSDIRFYQQTKPFSDLFTSINSQNNGLINMRFARNFADGINFSFSFRINGNINQRDEEGALFNRKLPNDTRQTWLYSAFPRGRNTAIGGGLWKHSEKYDGFLTFTTNVNQHLDKGGITGDSVFQKESPQELLAPLLTKATTKYKKTEISYLQYYKLNKKDSTGTKRNYLASHHITYKNALYQSSDPFDNKSPTKQDSIYYKSLLNDERGIRFYLHENQIENNFSLSTTRSRVSKDSFSSEKPLKNVTGGQNDWFEVGVAHSYHRLNWEASIRNINNIIAKGRWHFTPTDDIKIETYAQFNLLGFNVGDYRLNGELFYNVKNIGSLTVKAVNQLYEPSLIQSQLYLTQRPFWENNFKKTLETHLSGTLNIPRIGFEGTFGYTLLNNYIYLDKDYTPQQGSTPLSIVQLILSENIKLGIFHLDNTVILQKSTEKYLRLPDLYSKNSLYTEGKIFKKSMLARVGLDFRYNTDWFAPAYMSLLGQFYVQEESKVKAFPALDVFLSAKVKSFRVFAKVENIVGSFSKNVYYQIYNYPVPDRQIRFGIRWQLLN